MNFKVLLSAADRRMFPHCPRIVPLERLKPYEQVIYDHHGQDLFTLDDRGGLDPLEIRSAVEPAARPWRSFINRSQAELHQMMVEDVAWLSEWVRG